MNFELTILGSCSAVPTSEKYPTAQVLNLLERFFLIDCGEGTQIQLRRLKFSFAKIRHIFISHLHGDHFYGLPGFISTRNLLGITSDLHIWSHSDLAGLLNPLLSQMKGDLGFRIIFHPLNFQRPDKIFSDSKAEVFSFPLKHTIPCCGFLFREKQNLPKIRKEKIAELRIPISQMQKIKEGAGFDTGEGTIIPNEQLTLPPPPPRSYAFCTDTAYCESALETISGADLLYHEATFLSDLEDFAVKTLHSTARHAATVAWKAGVKKLIIGHFSTRYKNENEFLHEARQIFENTDIASEGKKFKVQEHISQAPNHTLTDRETSPGMQWQPT